MTFNKEHIRTVIESIPNESFQLKKILRHDFLGGVYVVSNRKLAGRLEDIKLLDSVEPNMREQFLKEGKVLSAMHHGNIPRVYDILECGDMLLFRSEHIEGYSIREILDTLRERKEKIPLHIATSLVLRLMNALSYAHDHVRFEGRRKRIIHCDIKPSNIILTSKNLKRKAKVDDNFLGLLRQGKVEPYLIDFGIARFSGEKRDSEGTLPYMSPEQLGSRDAEHGLTWRTDLYQLLLVYHEMLTDKRPYSAVAKNKIIEQKHNSDFEAGRSDSLPSRVKEIIEKGTRRDPLHSFTTEKACMKEMSKAESYLRMEARMRRYRWPVLSIAIIIVIILASLTAYSVWDYQTQSTDSIIRSLEQGSPPTIQELEHALQKLQKRSFEKKYYQPLLRGEFREGRTHELLYPSYLDEEGDWVLVGPNADTSGHFVELLFLYSEDYPDLLDYAKEYAEPILASEFEGTDIRRFQHALIPAYEMTKDERYLRKLINVTDTIAFYYIARQGTTQSIDLYFPPLLLFIHNKTGEEKYMEVYEDLITKFSRNNIDEDGYMYAYASVDGMSLYGPVTDDKANILVAPYGDLKTGNFVLLSQMDEETFKSLTSPFSADFVEAVSVLDVAGNDEALAAHDRAVSYYKAISPEGVDYFFISSLCQENSIPRDVLATVKAIPLFREDEDLYYQKLRAVLSSQYFRRENENGILAGNVIYDNLYYDHADETRKNQSSIETDVLFLELGRLSSRFR